MECSGSKAAALALLAVAAACPAADMAEFSLLGFARDGSHVAWEEYGVQDGSGFPWASLTVVSASSGRQLLSEMLVMNIYESGVPESWEYGDIDPLQTLRDSLRTLLAPELQRLGVEEGNTGATLLMRLQTDLSRYGSTEFVREWWGPGYARGPRYSLEVRCDSVATDMMYMQPLVALRLSLEAAGRRLVIARDGPEGAEVAYWYEVRSVHMYGDSTLAVVLSKGKPGFEGPDTRWRVVAAVLPEELRP